VLKNFEIFEEIHIILDDVEIDLHNCYEFVGMHFNNTSLDIQLDWRRLDEDWVMKSAPRLVSMKFRDVTIIRLKFHKHRAHPEDRQTLSSIGFLHPDDIELMECDHFIENVQSYYHMIFEFEDDSAIKIYSETVTAVAS